MFGIVIVSHGTLGEALVESAEMILEEKSSIRVVSMSSLDLGTDSFRSSILDAVDQVNGKVGTIVFTDLFGGTPCNLAISSLSLRPIEIIAGVNLPMVLKALSLKHQENQLSLEQIAEAIEIAGKKQISIVSKLIEP